MMPRRRFLCASAALALAPWRPAAAQEVKVDKDVVYAEPAGEKLLLNLQLG